MASIEKSTGMRTFAGWAILALPLLLVILIFINPVIHTLVLSFQEWKMMGTPQFVGLANYERVFQDEGFLAALGNTFGSPGILLRLLFLTAGPLALALLLSELRSGARIGLQAILAPLVLFSGAIVTMLFYNIYFSSNGGLAHLFTPTSNGEPVHFLVDPDRSTAVLAQFFLANGLAWALPFGTAFFMSTARGALLSAAPSSGAFWARTWRPTAAFAVAAVGFSLVSLEGSFRFGIPGGPGVNLFNYYFRIGLQMFQPGTGAAAILFLVIPLIILGVVFVLFLEAGRSDISIRFAPRKRENLTAGAAKSVGRTVMLIIAGAVVAAVVVALVVTVALPWLGAIIGLGERGALPPEEYGAPSFGASLALSLLIAVVSALLCWTVTAAAGFSFGYLRPRGAKWLLAVIVVFSFIGPGLLLFPYYETFRTLGVLNSVLSMILPCLLSPIGTLLFTWFFRGARDEKTAQTAAGGRIWGRLVLFSLPVIAGYMIASLNQLFLPLTMLFDPRTSTVPIFLMRTQSGFFDSGMGGQASLVQLSFIQYLIPLALLIISIIVVFPRLALVIRKKDEAMPGLDPGDVEKLKTKK